MTDPIIVLPQYYAERIIRSPRDSGILLTRGDLREGVFVVDGFKPGRGDAGGNRIGGSTWVKSHYAGATERAQRGFYHRVDAALHAYGIDGRRRSGALPLDDFKSGVYGPWIGLTRGGLNLAVTYADLDDGTHDWRSWILSEDEGKAQITDLTLVDEEPELLAPLRESWPVDDLAEVHVTVIGAGSIGSHVNEALAEYGIRRLTLVDPDRLLQHNFCRHLAHPSQLGRMKVTAERDRLLSRDPGVAVEALPLDVIYDADLMRPLFARTDIVVVAADGIDPRRTANHLARRAGKPIVFACVLEDGAFGEVLRVPSPRVGCLLCARAELEGAQGVAPERTLDRGYGEGTRHLPMTAVGGDLALVGQVAAKTVTATMLERRGHADQTLPGDHAVITLKAIPGMAAPFDRPRAGEVTWRQLPPPREQCPTCSTRDAAAS